MALLFNGIKVRYFYGKKLLHFFLNLTFNIKFNLVSKIILFFKVNLFSNAFKLSKVLLLCILISSTCLAEDFSQQTIDLIKNVELAFRGQLNELNKKVQDSSYTVRDLYLPIQSDIEKITSISADSAVGSAEFTQALERTKNRVAYTANSITSLLWQVKKQDSDTTFNQEQLQQIQRSIPEQLNFLREDIQTLENSFNSLSLYSFNPTHLIIILLSLFSLVSSVGFFYYYKVANDLKKYSHNLMERFGSKEKTFQNTLDYLKKVNDTNEHTVKEIQNLENKLNIIVPDSRFQSTTHELTEASDTLLQLIETQKNIISDAMRNSTKQSKYELAINNLVNFVEDISSKSKVVHDIAFKTKVLSFNASVEAERAGVRGRGFSIVAQEMKRLAEISGKASEEIATIVDKTRRGTQQFSKSNDSQPDDLHSSLNEVHSIIEKMQSLTFEFKDRLSTFTDIQGNAQQGLQEASALIQQLNHAQEQLRVINDEIFQPHQPWAS